jgi:hypothetical protein
MISRNQVGKYWEIIGLIALIILFVPWIIFVWLENIFTDTIERLTKK